MLASALQATGDADGAVAAARTPIALDPEDADTHSTLGEVLFEQDRPDEAIAALAAALALDPRTPTRSTTSRSRACARTTRRHGEQFEAAARLDPRHDVARHNLLHTGPAGRSFVYRRFSGRAARAGRAARRSASPGSVLAFLAVAIALEVVRCARASAG